MNKKQLAVAVGVSLAASLLFIAIANAVTTAYAPVPRYDSSLALALGQTQTSTMTMVSGVDGNGVSLQGPMCFTLDTGNSGLVEDVCGTASGTVVSNLLRGVDSSGFNSSTTLERAHRVGADVRITDSPYLVQFYELLSGLQSFPNTLSYNAHPTSTASTTIEDKNYIDTSVISGGVPASTGVPGISLLANQSQLWNGVSTAVYNTQTYSYIPQNQFFSHTASTSPVAVIASGTIDPSFLLAGNYNFGSTTAQSIVVASETFSNATSGILMTASSGSVSALQASTTGNFIQSNGNTWVSQPYAFRKLLMGSKAGDYGTNSNGVFVPVDATNLTTNTTTITAGQILTVTYAFSCYDTGTPGGDLWRLYDLVTATSVVSGACDQSTSTNKTATVLFPSATSTYNFQLQFDTNSTSYTIHIVNSSTVGQYLTPSILIND